MAYEQILYQVEDGVAVVTLNRPERMNAWTPVMAKEMRAAMHAAADDAAVRVIVITGAGRGFCSGADLERLKSISSDPDRSLEEVEPWDPKSRPEFRKLYSYFPAVPKPIICAINGACAGFGAIIPLYADMRFAADTAFITTVFASRGIIAEHGMAWLLPRIVGMAHAADMLYSARRVGAAEALSMGLVTRVFPQATFMDDVLVYARMLANEVSPRSLRVMKRQLWEGLFQTLDESIDDANVEMVESRFSEDFKEGLAHFLEKRPPAFTGR